MCPLCESLCVGVTYICGVCVYVRERERGLRVCVCCEFVRERTVCV